MRLMTMDVHHDTTTIAAFQGHARDLHKLDEGKVPTTIGDLKTYITGFTGKFTLVMEEGPLAAWLKRGLAPIAAEVIVADPRRNALIHSAEGKDDHIDVNSLQTLYLNKSLKPVYHTLDLKQQQFKDLVLHYHDVSRQVAAIKNKIIAFYHHVGVRPRGGAAYAPERRDKAAADVRPHTDGAILDDLFAILDQMVKVKKRIKANLARRSRAFGVIARLALVPGVGLITAVTFFAIIDTPDRFKRKSRLFKYCGLAVGNRSSNEKWLSRPGLLPAGNRLLKYVLISAAHNCCVQGADNPMRQYFQALVARGVSETAATNATARKIAATLWGMWKNGSDYRSEL